MAKATYHCTECGAAVEVIGRNRSEADRLAEYREASGGLCRECWTNARDAQRATESAKAAEQAASSGLPALTGSPKQIAWAETIRQQKLAILAETETWARVGGRHEGMRELFLAAIEAIRAIAEAHWWIENRDAYCFLGPREVMLWLCGGADKVRGLGPDDVIALARSHFGGLPRPAAPETAPAEIVADAKAEATIRPSSPVTETVAEIAIAEDRIKVAFPEKREDFWALIKKTLGYTWEGGCWQRAISYRNGPAAERAVETAHRLLAHGFAVRLYDPDLRRRAIAGEFAAEQTRWIAALTSGEHQGKLYISWGRDEDYYKPARALPRSAYSKPGVAVPAELFEEVMDFAGRYGFAVSPGAEAQIAQARANRDAALVADVTEKPRAKGEKVTGTKPRPLQTPDSEEVDDALRDD